MKYTGPVGIKILNGKNLTTSQASKAKLLLGKLLNDAQFNALNFAKRSYQTKDGTWYHVVKNFDLMTIYVDPFVPSLEEEEEVWPIGFYMCSIYNKDGYLGPPVSEDGCPTVGAVCNQDIRLIKKSDGTWRVSRHTNDDVPPEDYDCFARPNNQWYWIGSSGEVVTADGSTIYIRKATPDGNFAAVRYVTSSWASSASAWVSGDYLYVYGIQSGVGSTRYHKIKRKLLESLGDPWEEVYSSVYTNISSEYRDYGWLTVSGDGKLASFMEAKEISVGGCTHTAYDRYRRIRTMTSNVDGSSWNTSYSDEAILEHLTVNKDYTRTKAYPNNSITGAVRRLIGSPQTAGYSEHDIITCTSSTNGYLQHIWYDGTTLHTCKVNSNYSHSYTLTLDVTYNTYGTPCTYGAQTYVEDLATVVWDTDYTISQTTTMILSTGESFTDTYSYSGTDDLSFHYEADTGWSGTCSFDSQRVLDEGQRDVTWSRTSTDINFNPPFNGKQVYFKTETGSSYTLSATVTDENFNYNWSTTTTDTDKLYLVTPNDGTMLIEDDSDGTSNSSGSSIYTPGDGLDSFLFYDCLTNSTLLSSGFWFPGFGEPQAIHDSFGTVLCSYTLSSYNYFFFFSGFDLRQWLTDNCYLASDGTDPVFYKGIF